MSAAIVMVVAFICSCIGTRWYLGYARRHSILDIPNARSSHSTPVPRGGGTAFVAVTLIALSFLGAAHDVPASLVFCVVFGGAMVAAIGYLDDRRGVPALVRLLTHFAAATLYVMVAGGIRELHIMSLRVDLGYLGVPLSVLYLVWMLNLTNFMDGIDGIVGCEILTVCLCGIALSIGREAIGNAQYFPMLVAAATAGFLVWNWPPAKLFMGDVGSGFLGFCAGVVVVQSATRSPKMLWVWLVLFGAFICDATLTLLIRVRAGEGAFTAHRSHAYQRAAARFRSHRTVVFAVIGINLLWLFPIGFLVATERWSGVVGLIVAYTPVCALCLYLGAGSADVPSARPLEDTPTQT
jgi:Fuc2NAc and GlcNAc transferase